jgi:hypothetical protein
MRGREGQKIVVVAAHLGRGKAEGGDAQAGQGHRALGQEAHLDLAGDAQLFLQALLLRLLHEQALHARRHHVEGLREVSELVAALDADAVAEVALAQALRAAIQLVDVAGDGPGEHETEAEGDEVHHQEHAGHEGQQLHQHVADVERARREPPEEVVGLEMELHGDEVGFAVRPLTRLRGRVERDAPELGVVGGLLAPHPPPYARAPVAHAAAAPEGRRPIPIRCRGARTGVRPPAAAGERAVPAPGQPVRRSCRRRFSRARGPHSRRAASLGQDVRASGLAVTTLSPRQSENTSSGSPPHGRR